MLFLQLLTKIIHVGFIINFISKLYSKIVFYTNFFKNHLYEYVNEMEIDVGLR